MTASNTDLIHVRQLVVDELATLSGGLTATTGGLLVSAGNQSLLGTLLNLSPSPTIPTPTGSAQTISTSTGIISRVAPSGACTSAILQAGTVNGQIVIITNEQTVVANTITFNTAVATGFVLTDAGPTAITIKAASVAVFIWLSSLNSGNGAWVHVQAA